MRLSRDDAAKVVKHLKRAGHNRLGEAHKVYPAIGEWGIEYDVLPCNFGLLPPGVSRRSYSAKEDVRLEAASIKECICGYNDVIILFESVEVKAYGDSS